MRVIASETDLSDEELMRAAAAGRPEALAALYARYAPAVFGMARQSLERATAEEIVQEVFLAAWRGAGSFRPDRGPVRPWLFQIAHHRIANELRRRRRRPTEEADPDGEILESLPDGRPAPDEAAWTAYRRTVLRSAFDRLPAAQRQAIGLAFFEDLTHEQVASALKLPLGTAKSRIRAGLAGLRAQLAPLVASVGALVLLAALLLQQSSFRSEISRDERALTMLTSSDAQALRAAAAPGVAPETHAVYRFRPGSPLAVLTLSRFAAAPEGRVYQGWARHGSRWTSLGTALPDPGGKARLIAEDPAFSARPDAVEVTVEPRGGSLQPTGPVVAAWAPP